MNLPAKQQKCILVRGGLQIWVARERADKLQELLKKQNCPRFIEVNNQYINTYEIQGVFTPDAMEEKRRRANGQWTCHAGNWHDKGHECRCLSEAAKQEKEMADAAFYKKHGYLPL